MTTEMQQSTPIESAANKIACWRALLESNACLKAIQAYTSAAATPVLSEIATSAIKLSGDSQGQTEVEWFHAFALTQALDAEEALVMAGIASGIGTAPISMLEADLALDPYRPGIFLTIADQLALREVFPAVRDIAAAQLAMRQLICGARYGLNDYSNRRHDEAAFTSLTRRLISAIDSDFDQLIQADRDLIHLAVNNLAAHIAVGSSPDRIGTRTVVFFRGGERSITELVAGMKDCPIIYLLKGKRWESISYEDLVKLVYETESPEGAAALATKLTQQDTSTGAAATSTDADADTGTGTDTDTSQIQAQASDEAAIVSASADQPVAQADTVISTIADQDAAADQAA